MDIRGSAVALVVALLCFPFAGVSQQRESSIEELKTELAALRAVLDSLRSERARPLGFADDPLENLEERLEQRFAELDRKIGSLSNAVASVVFNPRTTAFINMAARVDSRAVMDSEGSSEISNRQFLRGLEVDFRAPVDPYAEAVAIMALENEGGEGYAIDPEEVYGILKRIPLLESAPLGMKLKLGKFRAPFGINNKLHLHDLPWITRPLVISKFLGTEHGDFFESGFNPVGIDMEFFLPNPFTAITTEINLDVVNGGEVGFARRSTSRPGFLGHLTVSRDWWNEHLLLAGFSAYTESGSHAPALFGIDLTYKWSPPERRMSTSFVLGGEVFFGSAAFPDSLGVYSTSKMNGWYAYTQYQLSYFWYLGARYDWVQDPANSDFVTRAASLSLSYYTTEFLRIRLGVERRLSTVPWEEPLTTGLFEINFVFGSHPTEPYWVNR